MIKQKFLTALLALLCISATGAWAQTETLLTTITATGKEQASYSTEGVATVSFSYLELCGSDYNAWGWWGYGWKATVNAAEGYTITKCVFYDDKNRTATDSEAPFVVETTEEDKTPKVNGTPILADQSKGIKKIEVYGYVTPTAPEGPEVTITGTSASDQGQQAEFSMPQNDVTVTYTLKRDMAVEMLVTVGDDPEVSPRFRVEQAGDKFQPVGQGSYTGTTPDDASNIFTLYQGYEVTVAPGEYVTYYQNEALTLDEQETAAELYTVSSVTATEAVLSDKLDVAPAETPLLVYNSSAEEKTFLLIPTTTTETVSVADEFKGTAVEKAFTADDMAAADYYVCTGKAFTWVKSAGTIAANKCWLQIGSQPATSRANTRAITGGNGTTGIRNTDVTDSTDGDFYDLNGRKLQGIPTKKGIYIKNGKKVVIK